MFSLCRDSTAGHYIITAYPQLLALLLFSSSPLALPLPCSLQSNSSLFSHTADIPPQLITSKLHFVLVKPRLPGSLLGIVIKKLLFYFIIGRCNITQEFVFSVCASVSSFKVCYVKWGYQPFCDSSRVYAPQYFYLFFACNRLSFVVWPTSIVICAPSPYLTCLEFPNLFDSGIYDRSSFWGQVGQHINTNAVILIFCWPCISIYLFININQLDALNFIISLFQASTCFEHMCSLSGGQNCIIQSLASSHL